VAGRAGGQECGGRGREGRKVVGGQGRGAGGVEEGADLVTADGFVFQQGGGELGEGVVVAGEQVAGAGFGGG